MRSAETSYCVERGGALASVSAPTPTEEFISRLLLSSKCTGGSDLEAPAAADVAGVVDEVCAVGPREVRDDHRGAGRWGDICRPADGLERGGGGVQLHFEIRIARAGIDVRIGDGGKGRRVAGGRRIAAHLGR